MQILQGQALALFAFDVGYEVILDRLSDLLAAPPVSPISQKKQTPSFLQYTRPPRVVSLGEAPPLLPGNGQVQATIFDFGAVSIAYRWPLGTPEQAFPLSELPALGQQLYATGLEADARKRLQDLLRAIQSAVVRPEKTSLVEDYYLFIIERLDQKLSAEELLRCQRQNLSQSLRLEKRPLSTEQQEEALGQRISYYETDLVVIDWNAAIIYDQDYEDTASVLELLNVELLEARYIDAQLDTRIQEYANLAQRHSEWPLPLRTPYGKAIQDLTELRVEAALLDERVGNALKLVGDLYLARVYSAGARRFYLREWESIISHKLDIIDGFYNVLNDRLRTAQNQTLEIAVIVLILVELVLALIRR
ncbi:MAG TPA: hypothetical protein VI756_14635 [Blastocatellia bacterium]